MPKLCKEFWVLCCKNSVLNKVRNATKKTVLETYYFLPLIASGNKVVTDYGNVGTQRICSQESSV